MVNFKIGRWTAHACLLLSSSVAVGASPNADAEPLVFGTDIASECDQANYQDAENVAIAAWASKFAVQALVGLAASAMAQATKPNTIARQAKTRGSLYEWNQTKKAWTKIDTLCIRFWHARVSQKPIRTDAVRASYGVDDSLATRWQEKAFVEPPYLYGEVLVTIDRKSNALGLDPVILYARQPPEAEGFWRRSESLSVAIDLTGIGGSAPFASHAFDLPDTSRGAVLLRDASRTGLGSGWYSMPVPPDSPPTFGEDEDPKANAGHFTTLVSLTSVSTATLLGSTVATTFNEEKNSLIEALTPRTRAERAAQQQAAVQAAFDAVSSVLEAEEALTANTEPAKDAKLRLAVRRAQYLADLKLQAAGLPARYGVTVP